ncbi:MAG: ABC transporter ATP-binding protein [Andreesenia angusta]|nr:ABC transporter ATP-binding protein [Andreesenia angusta]
MEVTKDKEMKKESNIRFILRKSGAHKYKIYLSAFSSAIASLCKLAPYVLVYKIITEIIEKNPDINSIKNYTILTAIAVILNILFTVIGLASSHMAAFSILYKLRLDSVEHLGHLNLGFFRRNSIGSIKKSLDEDIEKLELFIAHQIPDLFESLVIPIAVIIYLLYLKWWLALLLLVPFILATATQAWMYKSYNESMKEYNYYLKKLHGTIIQYIHGMNVFKAFNLTAKNFKNYVDIVHEYLKYWIKICDKSISTYVFGMELIDSGGILVVIPIGGLLYLSGGLDLPSFVMFLLLGTVFLNSFLKILNLGGNLSMLLMGAENVRKILEENPQYDSKATESKQTIEKGVIEFKNVNFAYEDKNVIKDFSLKIEENTTIALVGPSGSGKTTIGMLIGRFWDIEEGDILIDGKSLKEIPMSELMNSTSFVFQDVFMLNDSIFNNIMLGMDRTEEEIISACKNAQIHDFIMSLPDGYNTIIGEDSGIKLSGGEKQRISIARAILKDAKIVVLDEVTSYSDIDNERNIQKALKNLLKNKTAVIIAHRLYTIKGSDNIVVLDEGRIAEQGTHDKLLKEKGLYYNLWNRGDEYV